MQLALSDVECVRTEKSVNLLLELHQLRCIEGVFEHLCRENGQRLKEVDVWPLVRLDLRFELNEGLVVCEGLRRQRRIEKDDPAVGIRHLCGLLIQLFLL